MNTPTMQLLSWADEQGPDVARDLANAITLAQELHNGDFRESGDPYITVDGGDSVNVVKDGGDDGGRVGAVFGQDECDRDGMAMSGPNGT